MRSLSRSLLQALPVSVQDGLRRMQSDLYRRRFRAAASLPVSTTNPSAPIEIHTLLCHRDVWPYLYAIKSLLLYCDDVSVVLHDDGSLSAADAALLERQLPGIRIINTAAADAAVMPRLVRYPVLTKYRTTIPNAKQLLDFTLLAHTRKLISLDADVLFLDRPEEVLDWTFEPRPAILVGHEKEWASEQDRRLDQTELDYFPNINIGFMCFDRDLLNLDRAEEIIPLISKEPDWWSGQAAIAVLIQDYMRLHPGRAQYLDGDRYIHNNHLDRPAVMKHYWAVRRHGVGWPSYKRDLKQVRLGASQSVRAPVSRTATRSA